MHTRRTARIARRASRPARRSRCRPRSLRASQRGGHPKRGGELRIARIEDSQSFDKTNVFQNESIWIFEQINEPLYTRHARRQERQAVARDELHGLERTRRRYTFKLRQGVKFSNGQPMTVGGRQVLDRRRPRADEGLGLPRRRDQERHRRRTRRRSSSHLKYPWAPFLADIALFANGIIPKNFAGETRAEFYKHPVGTGPFMWDKRVVGQSVTFKRNPYYWQKGKPYLDSVTWTYVSRREHARAAAQGRPDRRSTSSRRSTRSRSSRTRPGVKMTLFPSTRTDYLLMNEQYAPLADVHVRRAISYAIDREAIVKVGAVRQRQAGELVHAAAGAVLRPELARVSSTTWRRRRPSWRSRTFPNGFKVERWSAPGAGRERDRPDHPAGAEAARHQRSTFKQVDTSTEFAADPAAASTSSASATGRWTSPTRTSS